MKTPKIYIRDSGLTHALLNLTTLEDVLGHPVVGASWEGFAMESLLSCLPTGASYWFYQTSAGAEIDLVIEMGLKKKYAIEIKRSMTPTLSKGFHFGCQDINANGRFIVYPGNEGSLLSCNEGAAFREAVKPVVYADSISPVPLTDTVYGPVVLPRHTERDFAVPLYPLLPLSISEEPTWEYPEEMN